MEFLAGYGEDADNSSNSLSEKKIETAKPTQSSLQAEWDSFEKMIGGGTSPETVSALGATAVDPASFLQSGIIAYPGLGKSRTRSFTESSGDEPKSADLKLHSELPNKMTFSFEEVQDIGLPSEVARASRSRSRSSSASSRSSSRSSRSSSASSVDKKKDKVAPPEPSRSSTSPRKGGSKSRSRSRSRSHSAGRKRKSHSRSRSRSRGKKSRSHRSPGRKDRSSSRSRRHRHGRSRSRDRHRRHRRHGSKERRSRSRDRNRRRKRRRSHSRDRKKRSGHHRRRSHSRSRGRRKRSKGRKSRSRSRSRDRHNRSRSRDRHHRSRSDSRDRHKRSRSRSRERPARSVELASTISSNSSGYGHKEKPMTFKEQMRQQLLKASKILKNGDAKEGTELSMEKPANMAMSQSNILKAMAASVNSATASGVTPQMALLQTMAAMHQKAQELTGVTVPKYYNPAAVNPLKYAEQVQKRKLLWSKNKDSKDSKDETTATSAAPSATEAPAATLHKGNEWQKTSFAADQDGKMAAKFRKLMGMKEGDSDEGTSAELSEEQQRKQQELFSRLDKEYEFARMATHTHRGVGLGFASQLNPNTSGP